MFADQIAIRPGNRHASLRTANLYRIKTKQTAFTVRASERRTAGVILTSSQYDIRKVQRSGNWTNAFRVFLHQFV